MSAAGISGVWATENSREAIFTAFKRKEVYGTTGPRIEVRMFGGWEFEPYEADAVDISKVGYAILLRARPANPDATPHTLRGSGPQSRAASRVSY